MPLGQPELYSNFVATQDIVKLFVRIGDVAVSNLDTTAYVRIGEGEMGVCVLRTEELEHVVILT